MMSSFQDLFLILMHHGRYPWLFYLSPLGYSQGAICLKLIHTFLVHFSQTGMSEGR